MSGLFTYLLSLMSKTYSVFGAGAAGLYTAWRLLDGKSRSDKGLNKGDTLELYDWGKYDFSASHPGSRAPGARVCTWHYQDDKTKSYLELGGMRYSDWDGTENGSGHRLVTTVISELGLKQYSVPFNESTNPLLYLRTKNMYLNQITSDNPAPYNADHYSATDSPDTGFNTIERLAVTATTGPQTRAEWRDFYPNGKINVDMPESSVYKKGDRLKDTGNGYVSNEINRDAAVVFEANNEYTPGTKYKTLTRGYSFMFTALFDEIVRLAKKKGVYFEYYPNTRLHSILEIDGIINYSIAIRENPNKKFATKATDAAWMAMPRYAIDLVAQATRYESNRGTDVLNDRRVQLYLKSAVMQPSYKIGMFFDEPWWTDKASTPPPYPAQLTSYEITVDVLHTLAEKGFPKSYIRQIGNDAAIVDTPYTTAAGLTKAIEQCIRERLTFKQEELLLATAECNTIGPSVTDMPIRQVVYFGDNAPDKEGKKIYGLLASYDDGMYTSFWQELEPDAKREVPLSEDYQPLIGPRKASEVMIKMLRQQLAAVHFGPQSDYSMVPKPLETRYMDWSLPPFNAGYHAYAGHYNICDVQQKIRKPSQLLDNKNINIFIVGEAYSNDQAWVEGAFCTAESVLNDFFDIKPIINNKNYPFICSGCEIK